MAEVMLDLTAEEIKKLLLQLPPAELLSLMEELDERVQTLEMMQLAETGFQEWNEAGEDIYDVQAQGESKAE